MYLSKYFPQKSQIYFKLILKYMDIIFKDINYYKNTEIDIKSYKNNKINIIQNGKKETLDCIIKIGRVHV